MSSDLFQGKLEFNNSTGWTLVSMGIGDGALIISEEGSAYINIPGIIQPNGCYIMEIKYRNTTASGIVHAEPGSFRILFDAVTVYSSPTITELNAGTFQIPFTWGNFAFSGDINFISDAIGNKFNIEYIRIFPDPACGIPTIIDASFCSQCIAIKYDTGCTKQITANMDIIQDDSGFTHCKTAYGFYWDYVFRPMLRATGEFHSPDYPSDVDAHLYEDGSHKVTGAELQKKWEFAVKSITEAEQDALRMMIRTDLLGIFDDDVLQLPDDGDFYFCPSKDIAGAWPKKEKPTTSDIEFELQRKNKDAIFNRNLI